MDAPVFGEGKSAKELKARRRNYTYALISEIRLLVRTISDSPTKRVSNLKLNCMLPVGMVSGETSAQEHDAPEIINAISYVEEHIDEQSGIASIGFLQLVRDALVAMTDPATGLTIAYTTLVAGEERSELAESRFTLAEMAYELLSKRAALHRRAATILTVVAILFTVFAAWEATKASLGKNLLQNLDLLQSQQAVISAEKLKLEFVLGKSAGDADLDITEDGPIPIWAVPLCDRYRVRASRTPDLRPDLNDLRFDASPAERELCGRDTILARNLEIARFNLKRYQEFWPGFAGGVIGVAGEVIGAPGRLMDHFGWFKRENPVAAPCTQEPKDDKQVAKSPKCNDLEFVVAPMLQVNTNYLLPITFGFLGSLLYVLLDHFTKLRANTLSPRDFPLMALRLIIGLVVAACVSLLLSSSASPGVIATGSASGVLGAGALASSLISTASGITFLAGFGAEAVVTLLQSLVTRVFTPPKQG